MTMAWIWTAMAAISVVFSVINGKTAELGAAALQGGQSAVTLCLSICGVLCLWSGIIEIMQRCGLAQRLSRLLKPVIRRLLPSAERTGASEAVAANISANLLGLGNAATPAGIKAASLLAAGKSAATNDLCTFVVLNTASIQLIPATVAAVRQSAGAGEPFDILPAVWLTSACALAAGLLSAKLFAALGKKR